MNSSLLGIDIGTDSLKLAHVSDGEVKRTLRIDVPADLLKHGIYTTAEPLGRFLRDALKESGLRVHDAAVTLPHDVVTIRHAVLSCATDEEAAQALPQEFPEISPAGRHRYLFDYLTLDSPSGTPGEAVPILAAYARRSFVESLHDAADIAGLRLIKISPAVCSFISAIRSLQEGEGASYLEYCIADLGLSAVRLYMFRNDRLTAEYSFPLEHDRDNLDSFVDEFSEALGHYRIRHLRSPMTHVWPVGGCALDPAYRSALTDRLKLRVHRAAELIPGSSAIPDSELFVQAAGVALFRPGREPS